MIDGTRGRMPALMGTFVALVSGVTCCAEAPELPTLASRGALAIRSVAASADTVGRYEKLELTVDLSAIYDNPFDPEQVDLTCRFVSPAGQARTAIGFFYQPYRIRGGADDAKTPLLEAAGQPCWKVRFTPAETGEYRYQVRVRDRSAEVQSEPGILQVVESDRPGFIRVSKSNPRCFAFDDGTSYFPLGQNLQNDWPVYRHSKLLAEAGCNAVRAWTFCHWTWLEWTFKPGMSWAGPGHYMRSYGGAGSYNQRVAWIADHHLAKWEQDGLFAMLCLGNGSELGSQDNYDSWGGHPYNVVNGGFLSDGEQFWTDPRARKLYRQRLRYVVARYGYSPNVRAWEFWNELGQENDAVVAWHAEMSRYLKEIDLNTHLVTTSHWGNNAERNTRTWEVPELDFTQTHNYAGADTIRERTRRMLEVSPKPHVIGEGGGPHTDKSGTIDPDGIDFHNSLWAAALSGAAGTTLPWWWRERIEPKNLFWHYTAFAAFARTVPWAQVALRPLDESAVRLSAPSGQNTFRPVLLVPQGPDWGNKAVSDEFTVTPEGALPWLEELSPVLYGTGRTQWRTTPTIQVDFPVEGQFIVRVGETSQSVLEIDLDGRTVLRDDSLAVPRESVERDFTVPVPAGRHQLTLRNAGSDWMRLGHLLLTNYRDASKHSDLDVYGLRSERLVVLWFHHRLNEWAYRELGIEPAPVEGASATVTGLPAGECRIEWWDTYKGKITVAKTASSHDGRLELTVPTVAKDVACVIRGQ